MCPILSTKSKKNFSSIVLIINLCFQLPQNATSTDEILMLMISQLNGVRLTQQNYLFSTHGDLSFLLYFSDTLSLVGNIQEKFPKNCLATFSS